jgi:hypothetical protein
MRSLHAQDSGDHRLGKQFLLFFEFLRIRHPPHEICWHSLSQDKSDLPGFHDSIGAQNQKIFLIIQDLTNFIECRHRVYNLARFFGQIFFCIIFWGIKKYCVIAESSEQGRPMLLGSCSSFPRTQIMKIPAEKLSPERRVCPPRYATTKGSGTSHR